MIEGTDQDVIDGASQQQAATGAPAADEAMPAAEAPAGAAPLVRTLGETMDCLAEAWPEGYPPSRSLQKLRRRLIAALFHLAVLDKFKRGKSTFINAEKCTRCRRVASVLYKRGVGRDDTVAVVAPNVPEIYEAHFGVPIVGAVLNTLNIRLYAEAITFQLAHGEAKVLITDREFSETIQLASGTPPASRPNSWSPAYAFLSPPMPPYPPKRLQSAAT